MARYHSCLYIATPWADTIHYINSFCNASIGVLHISINLCVLKLLIFQLWTTLQLLTTFWLKVGKVCNPNTSYHLRITLKLKGGKRLWFNWNLGHHPWSCFDFSCGNECNQPFKKICNPYMTRQTWLILHINRLKYFTLSVCRPSSGPKIFIVNVFLPYFKAFSQTSSYLGCISNISNYVWTSIKFQIDKGYII